MIVFVHPLASGPRFWSGVRDRLPALATHAVDLAQVPARDEAERGLAALTDAVAEEIAATDDGAVTVVGVSLGALVALDLATRHPRLVQRLVLADSVPVYPGMMQQMWRQRADIARTEGIAGLLEPTLRLWFSPRFLDAGGPELDAVVQTFTAFDPLRYARHCEILAGVDLRARAHEVSVPTLVVCGTHDSDPFVEAARWFEQAIAGAQLAWVDGGHHAAALEFPDQFASLVYEFVSAAHPIR
ncbi:alpha/beta fold hydrolase [Mycolicibacterium sp.]|uniref:alpha/beta fold hydrolase n=1 Tax=Mycolicibacterium sp. TaxID=2320850 RepID=UPI003D0E770B